MNDSVCSSIAEIDKDLAPSWIELNDRVRHLVSELRAKTAGSVFAEPMDQLAEETSRLCDHVNRIHEDVTELLSRLEENAPAYEPDTRLSSSNPEEVEREWARIQTENHELRADFKDVLKALFMWRDDPYERAREERP